MEYEIITTSVFSKWIKGAKDHAARKAILARVNRITAGTFGEYKSVGNGVSELKTEGSTMKTETKPLDIKDFLHTEAELADYINDAYHDDDPRMFLIAIGSAVKSKGVSTVAQETGLGRESLYKIFSGAASPNWSTLKRLLDNLGIEITLQAKRA